MPLPPHLERWLQHEDDELVYGREPERRGTQRDITPPEEEGETSLPRRPYRFSVPSYWGWFWLCFTLAWVPLDLYALVTSPSWFHGVMALTRGALAFCLWRVRWLWNG